MKNITLCPCHELIKKTIQAAGCGWKYCHYINILQKRQCDTFGEWLILPPPSRINQPGGLRSGHGHSYSRQKRSCSSCQTHDVAAGANGLEVNTPSRTQASTNDGSVLTGQYKHAPYTNMKLKQWNQSSFWFFLCTYCYSHAWNFFPILELWVLIKRKGALYCIRIIWRGTAKGSLKSRAMGGDYVLIYRIVGKENLLFSIYITLVKLFEKYERVSSQFN